MAYTKQDWHDAPATDTPISAERLSYIEDGIEAAHTAAAAAAESIPDVSGKEDKANRNTANGYVGLDASGKVAAAQLPSFVDDVLEFASLAAFPATGDSGKIYTALDSNKIYRWSGSTYIEIAPSPGSTDVVPEGATNLYFTAARADSRVAAGITGKVDKATTIFAGTGLAGGGDLSANRELVVAFGSTAGTACQGSDARLSDARTPTAAGQVADLSLVVFGKDSARAAGTGDFPFGVKLQRAITFSSATFRALTADASGSLVVGLYKNGVAVSGATASIAYTQQVSGLTLNGTWAFAAGDIITVQVTGVGSTPGKGLIADIKGTTA